LQIESQDTAEKKDKKKEKKEKKKRKKNKDKSEAEDSEAETEDRKDKRKEKSKRKESGTQETKRSEDDEDFSIVSLSKRKGTGVLVVNPRPKRLAAEQVKMIRSREPYNLATRQPANCMKFRWMKVAPKRRTARMNRSQQSASNPYLMPVKMTYAS